MNMRLTHTFGPFNHNSSSNLETLSSGGKGRCCGYKTPPYQCLRPLNYPYIQAYRALTVPQSWTFGNA